ncbi:protein anachronism [Toxorhynchites rutilus septentrionalis]|uniref:protein anachronism n=1 Tax=Toxorhynchites rutilus septentrionalis TaxID=329112 RepID=UPI002479FAF5|nr:protein anachronism [Toxorhynchites rutilus septentrionalis]
MKFLLLFVVTCSWEVLVTSGAPFNSYDTMDEMLVPESKVLDFDNLTESERVDLLRNQINITAVRLQQQLLRAAAAQKNMQRAGAPMAIKQSATEPNISSHVQNRKVIEKHIIGNIKHNIESNLMRNDSLGHAGATHEMAFSAVCDLPKHTNQSFWEDDYTWNLFFRLPHSKPYTSVSTAILRLYMNGAANSTEGWNRRESDNCKDPSEQMIRVTVSVYWRKKSKDNSSTERKKRICSSITITRNFRGWITLDTLLAVKLWDKPNRNFGIAIDVQDQDDNPLPAARFFQSTDCSEASKSNATAAVLPWNFFRNSLSWSSDEMDDVPHVPRIDVMMHKSFPQHHYFASHHYHQQRPAHHRVFRPKFHYGSAGAPSAPAYNVRYRFDPVGTAASTATNSGNSYETEEVEIKQHPSVHSHHSLTKPHKKRHLTHHRLFADSAEGSDEEDDFSSASLEERKI